MQSLLKILRAPIAAVMQGWPYVFELHPRTRRSNEYRHFFRNLSAVLLCSLANQPFFIGSSQALAEPRTPHQETSVFKKTHRGTNNKNQEDKKNKKQKSEKPDVLSENPAFYLSIFPEEKAHYTHAPCLPYARPDAPAGRTLTQAAMGHFDTLHLIPFGSTPPASISHIHGTLFKGSETEEGIAYPYVSESVTRKKNAVIFKLNPQAVFHDGTPVTPEDVIFSYRTLTKNSPLMKQQYAVIRKAFQSSPQEVTFELQPDACREAALIISGLIILPKAFCQKHDFKTHPWVIPVGCGPYRLYQFERGRFVRYQKVKNWWGAGLMIAKGAFRFDNLIFEYFKDMGVAFEAFKRGELDIFHEPIMARWMNAYTFPALCSAIFVFVGR